MWKKITKANIKKLSWFKKMKPKYKNLFYVLKIYKQDKQKNAFCLRW